jgi:two-component system heavy metal sensor histidine kinase CusS
VTRPWFLRNRITVAFGLTTFLLSLAISLPFGWAVHNTIQEEIDALAREELEETKAHFENRSHSPEDFVALAGEMRADHPDNPLAWRIWRDSSGELWSEFGTPELLAVAPRERPTESGVRELDEHLRLATGELDGGLTVAVLLDCTREDQRFARFIPAALGFILLATGVATLAGYILGRRVSGLLAGVAECARTEEAVDRWPAPSSAPQEIQAVVRALQDTLRRIREESENATLLVSGLAHELRSPIQNLMGETQVALLRERETSEYRRVLESHLEDLSDLSSVVDNLVTMSSLEEVRRRRSLEHFDIAGETRMRLTREHQLAVRRGVGLEVAAGGPLEVDGDREALLLALRNLMTNAIEWSPTGKKVEVRMGPCEGGLEIVVDDAGPGVRPSERERIFRPFYRGDAANGRRVGFGLGLALTHSAVRAQGGSIEVGDSPLGGARFRIFLPTRGRGERRDAESDGKPDPRSERADRSASVPESAGGQAPSPTSAVDPG